MKIKTTFISLLLIMFLNTNLISQYVNLSEIKYTLNTKFYDLELPKIKFYVEDLQDKYKNGLLRDHLDAVNYIQEYYLKIEQLLLSNSNQLMVFTAVQPSKPVSLAIVVQPC